MDNPKTGERFIIRAKTPAYYQEIKKLYASGMGRAQVHRILDITKGDIVGLKVARHLDTPKIWFTYRGHRYDIKGDGTLVAEVKTGTPAVVPQHMAKKVRCQLCGKETPIPRYDMQARCPICGFPLVKCNVIRRS
jgi:ribosomal protein L37E